MRIKIGGEVAETEFARPGSRFVAISGRTALFQLPRPSACCVELIGSADIETQQVGRRDAARMLPHQSQHALGCRLRILPIASLHFQHRELRKGLRKIGTNRDRALTGADRVLEMPVAREHVGERIMRFGKVGLEARRLDVMGRGLVDMAALHQRVAEIVVNLGGVRPQLGGAPVILDRLLQLALPAQKVGKIVQRRDVIGITRDRPAVLRDRFLDTSALAKQVGQSEMPARAFRLDVPCFIDRIRAQALNRP